MPTSLPNREHELEALAAAFDGAAAGRGALVVVEGSAGIGKTTLLGAAAELAAARGMAVLSAGGGELEREFGFGVVRRLFERAVRAEPKLLEGAAGHAAAAIGLDGAAAPGFATLHGLYWLTAGLAERGPLLLAIDDAHWADEESLMSLAYIARRLEDLPVVLAIAARDGRALQERRPLAAMAADPRTEVLRLAALDEAGVAAVVERFFGVPGDDAFVAAVATATGGNPFLVVELLRDLGRAGLPPLEAAVGDVAARGPEAISRSLLLRLDALPPGSRALAAAVSVLDGDDDGRCAAELAELDDATAAAAGDALVDAGVLASGAGLSFAHPIARQAVYGSLPPAARAAAHERAARLLHARGAPPDAVAAHLANVPGRGSEWASARLGEAAAAAIARGAPVEAAAMLRRALLEPPPEPAPVLAALARAEAMVGDPAAVGHYREALAAGADSRLGLELGQLLLFAGDAAAALEALLAVDAADRETRLLLAAELLAVERVDPAARAARPAGVVPAPDELTGATPGERAVLSALALAQVMRAEPPGPAVELAERALSDARALADEGFASPTCLNAVTVLMLADELDAVDAWLARAGEQARERGDVAGHAAVATFRSHAALRRGQAALALDAAREAIAQATAHGLDVLAGLGVAFMIDAALETGAEADLEAFEGELADHFHLNAVLGRRGRLRAVRGRPEDGVADLLEAGRRLVRAGIENPTFGSWRSDAALALARMGRSGEAAALAREELELARAVGRPRAIAIALRAQARLEGALEIAREAAAVAATGPDRLLEAHALADVGAALRAAGERVAAREPLRVALELAVRCAATPLAERVREELRATGARPREPGLTGAAALTPSELRCARMAASGMRNREIAQALFVSVRAVEMHLSSAYRTLGISSRHELSGALDQR